ncbi:hypothetical protein ACMFMG_012087 [Clarireedia jacksonii]
MSLTDQTLEFTNSATVRSSEYTLEPTNSTTVASSEFDYETSMLLNFGMASGIELDTLVDYYFLERGSLAPSTSSDYCVLESTPEPASDATAAASDATAAASDATAAASDATAAASDATAVAFSLYLPESTANKPSAHGCGPLPNNLQGSVSEVIPVTVIDLTDSSNEVSSSKF